MNLPIPPEFDLLCLAARPAPYQDMEALRRVVATALDWPAVIEGAKRNRVTSIILDSLQECNAPQVSPDAIAELKCQGIESAARSLVQILALQSLCTGFTQARIRFLIVKGIPLSLQLYGDATRRAADDIDVLVPPDQFFHAHAVLTQLGYRCDTELRTTERRETYVHWVKDLTYTHEVSKTKVELHHRLTANPYLLEWPFDELWKVRFHVRVGDTDVATLPSGKLPLYLLAHGANHGWERLRWLMDLTAVLPTPEAVANLAVDAERAGLRPALLQALTMAHELLGFPVDGRYLNQAYHNSTVKWLDFCLSQFWGRKLWRRRPQANSREWLWRFSIWFFIYNVSLKVDWRYRGYQCAAMWVHPPDWDIVRLPSALFWLYPIVRPFGWLMRRLQR